MRETKDSNIKWVGEIPSTWITELGKHFMTCLDRPVKEDDGVITCFRDGEVTLRSKRREEGFTVSFQEIGYQGIEPGDLVVHGMDGFAGAIGISDSRGKATPVLNVLNTEQDKRYMMYTLRNMAYTDVFLALSTGIRVRSCDTSWKKLRSLEYALPPLDEQRKIADKIEQKSKQVDALIANQQAQIEKLKQYKQSLITEVVTKGLDSNASMKDSGVECIGRIPINWRTGKIHAFAEFFNGDRTSRYPKPEELLSEGIPFLNSTNINGDSLDLTECKYISLEKYNTLSGAKIDINDILYCLRGSIGKCAINLTEKAGTVASSLMTIRCKESLNPHFLLYVLLSSVISPQVYLSMNGTCAANLSAESVGNFVIKGFVFKVRETNRGQTRKNNKAKRV